MGCRVIRRPAITASTSNADDAAYRALRDVAEATDGIEDARIVGGQMVGLLATAFPTAASIIRRTADADTAVSTQVAASGALHSAFTGVGYEATSGNRYESDDGRAIDVLVPSDDRFHQVEFGGRGFDAMPGLRLTLAADPIVLDIDVTLMEGARLQFVIKVPPVEHALILKALTIRSRRAPKTSSTSTTCCRSPLHMTRTSSAVGGSTSLNFRGCEATHSSSCMNSRTLPTGMRRSTSQACDQRCWLR
jgi:hypothetical protein